MCLGRTAPGEILWEHPGRGIYWGVTDDNVRAAVKYAILGFHCDPVEKVEMPPMLNPIKPII
jgi:hypothetical protein